MPQPWICDAIRTPIGRYGGALASVRPDDLCVTVLEALIQRNAGVDWTAVDDLLIGCVTQAGEDNRNVARMAGLLSGLPVEIPGITLNRLCSSGMDAVAIAARTIKAGEGDLFVAGGVESMSRAPFVVAKSQRPFDRTITLEDTTLGWRLVNPKMAQLFGTHSLPETGENVAEQFGVSREDQDSFALRSQRRTHQAKQAGFFQSEIVPVSVTAPKADPIAVADDEHPRPDATIEKLARLRPIVKPGGTITAGNASGINDGACALLVASDAAVERFGLSPIARVVATTTVGVPPRIMGMGPVPATRRLLERTGLALSDMDVIELNEAFASQSLAVLRQLGLPDDAEHVNPNGGAIALGHPLGMSGARLVTTAAGQLQRTGGQFALCTMCIGVGQGIAMLLERA